MIAEMFDVAEGGADQATGLVTGVAFGWVKSLAAITAPDRRGGYVVPAAIR